MLYLTCTTITSVDLAHYGVSRVKDWVSGDCGTSMHQWFSAIFTKETTIKTSFYFSEHCSPIKIVHTPEKE